MKVAIAAVAAVLNFAACMAAGPYISGAWEGTLTVTPQVQLKLVINLKTDTDGKHSVTLDSPDQGAYGIPGEVKYLSADSFNVAVRAIGAGYSGYREGNKLVGIFTQGALKAPLVLSQEITEARRPQTPEPPFPYSAREVAFSNQRDNVTLAGTLTLPKGYTADTPAVVMVTGSGLQNRDEEVFGHKPFAVIADWLARNGVASLRYDDRGYGKSTGDGATATTEDFARDAHSAVKFMRETARFNRVGVLGHSEGATVAFMLGADSAADFIIAMGAQGVRGDSILIDQSETMLRDGGVPDEFIADYTEALRRLYEVKIAGGDMAAFASVDALCADWATDHIHNSLKENLRKIASEPNAWLRHFIGFSPAADIAATSCPVLVLYGEKDTQVRPGLNMPAVKRSAPAADVRLYPGLNHLMQHATTGSIAEYNTIEETISPEVLTDITAFVTAQ